MENRALIAGDVESSIMQDMTFAERQRKGIS